MIVFRQRFQWLERIEEPLILRGTIELLPAMQRGNGELSPISMEERPAHPIARTGDNANALPENCALLEQIPPPAKYHARFRKSRVSTQLFC